MLTLWRKAKKVRRQQPLRLVAGTQDTSRLAWRWYGGAEELPAYVSLQFVDDVGPSLGEPGATYTIELDRDLVERLARSLGYRLTLI